MHRQRRARGGVQGLLLLCRGWRHIGSASQDTWRAIPRHRVARARCSVPLARESASRRRSSTGRRSGCSARNVEQWTRRRVAIASHCRGQTRWKIGSGQFLYCSLSLHDSLRRITGAQPAPRHPIGSRIRGIVSSAGEARQMLAPFLASSCIPPTVCGQDDPLRGVAGNDGVQLYRFHLSRFRYNSRMSQRAYYALLVAMLAMSGPILYLTRAAFVIHPVLCWGIVSFCVIIWIPKISGAPANY